MTSTPGFNSQVYQEAIEWFVRMRDGENDIAARTELTAWLRRSPEHVRAYLETASIWTEVRGVRAERVGDAETLVARALAQENVHELPSIARIASGVRRTDVRTPEEAGSGRVIGAGRTGTRAATSRTKYRVFLVAASVLVAVVALALVGRYALEPGSETYTTRTGEQRAILLADGSRIELNAQSSIRVRFSDQARTVQLQEGQAFFEVAKDPGRPFIVRSEEAQVRAVGTAFDIYRQSAGTLVTVVEGKVLVDRRGNARRPDRYAGAPRSPVIEGQGASPSLPARPQGDTRRSGDAVELIAGEQVLITARVLAEPKAVDVRSATAWTQQKLVFESASLSEVAREFNRYNKRPLVVREGGLEDFRISAVFPSRDPGSLIRFLREQPGIRVEETPEAIRISAVAAPD